MDLHSVRFARLVAVVALIALAAIAGLFVLMPRFGEVEALRTQTSEAADENLRLRAQERELLTLADEAPQRAAEAQELFAAMPRTADLPEVLTQITGAATAAGIKPGDISVLNTSIPVAVTTEQATAAEAATSLGVNLATIRLDLSVTGNRASLLRFLQNLQNLDRAMLIQSSTITSTSSTTPGAPDSMAVSGTMFVLQSSLPDLVKTAEDLVATARAGGG